jgi:hypothetical protein
MNDSPIPTTYGHDTHTQVWTSENGLWDITRHDVYARSGELKERKYMLYGAYDAVLWPINSATANNDFYPKYVRQAIRRHFTEV